MTKTISATLLTRMLCGSVVAQNNCACGTGSAFTTSAALQTLLAGKTVCAAVGDEQFCGAAFGGRDIKGATVLASPGPQSCFGAAARSAARPGASKK